MSRYLLDTQLYIDAINSTEKAAAFRTFAAAFLQDLMMSSVVVGELLIGAHTSKDQRNIEQRFVDPLKPNRIVTPSHADWMLAAETLRILIARHGNHDEFRKRSFFNDVLIAASCRTRGCTLVTNDQDFAMIASVLPLQYAAPWPTC